MRLISRSTTRRSTSRTTPIATNPNDPTSATIVALWSFTQQAKLATDICATQRLLLERLEADIGGASALGLTSQANGTPSPARQLKGEAFIPKCLSIKAN
jgi:hypothetical protein